MKKLIVGLLIAASTPISILAQNLKVVKATCRSWAGGIPGTGGTDYSVILKSDKGNETLDSIYIEKVGYKITHNKYGAGNLSIDSVKHTYGINMQISYHYSPYYHTHQDTLVNKKSVPAPVARSFEGDAMITYYSNGEKQLFIIKKLEVLPSVAYP